MTKYIIEIPEEFLAGYDTKRDITPLVRCRDCRHYMDYEHDFEPHLGYCREHDREEVRDSWFCSWGERKKDE